MTGPPADRCWSGFGCPAGHRRHPVVFRLPTLDQPGATFAASGPGPAPKPEPAPKPTAKPKPKPKPTPKPKLKPKPKARAQAGARAQAQAQPHDRERGIQPMTARPPHLLLVDDDARLVALLEDRLRRDGFEATVATRGRQAIRAIDRRFPDLVILDLMLPDMRGEQVAAQIKKRADLPIIVLSPVTEAASRAASIGGFAEDYLVKPFQYADLRVRVERVLRRMPDRVPAEEREVATGLVLTLRRREAVVNGKTVRLTPVESRFLGALVAAGGQPLTTEQLLARVWAGADGADPVYVWVTIRRLRQKLEADPSQPMFIHTVKGGGYRIGDPARDDQV